MPCQHLVENDAQGIDIRLSRDFQSLRLFRRKIVDRSDDGSRKGHGLIRYDLGNAKIDNFRLHAFRQDNILRFDVTMDDVVAVGVFQRRCQLQCQGHGQGRIQTAVLFLKRLQRDPFHVFHDDIVQILVLADIIDIDDGRMDQAGRRLGFPFELLHLRLVVHKLLAHNLDGHLAVQKHVPSQVDFCHAAEADGFQHFIAPVQDFPYHVTAPPCPSHPRRFPAPSVSRWVSASYRVSPRHRSF